MADPQLIGAFSIPCHRSFGAEDFHEQPVLASRGDLADGHRSLRRLAHLENHSRRKSSVVTSTSEYSDGCSVLPLNVSTDPLGFLRVL
jgi:hypothetical protein